MNQKWTVENKEQFGEQCAKFGDGFVVLAWSEAMGAGVLESFGQQQNPPEAVCEWFLKQLQLRRAVTI